MSANSSTVYEAWVLGLRAWRTDPLTDLTHLPNLDETSFPPVTYDRLIHHLNDAINEFMRRWKQQFSVGIGAAKEPHTIARALVDARIGLAHRLHLARHPALPPTIRTQLVDQAESDIRRMQRDLEDGVQHAARSGSTVSRSHNEMILRLYRDNALTAVLDPSFSLDRIDDPVMRRADTAETDHPIPSAEPFQIRRRQRLVVIPTAEEPPCPT